MDQIKAFLEHHNDLIQSLASLLTVLTAFLTFWLALQVHKKYQANKAIEKQISVVIEVVSMLNDSQITLTGVHYTNDGGSTSFGWNRKYNVFELAALLNTDQEQYSLSDFDDECLLLTSNCNQIIDGKRFIDNPFLPSSIADELMNFHIIIPWVVSSAALHEQEAIVIKVGSSIWRDESKPIDEYSAIDLFETNTPALASLLALKKHSASLKNVIEKWFRYHNINDVNFRADYKTPDPF